ncbi:unnamed protein product [Linum tenue]|uniref:RxLR effector protein n=1 Tax=Linum tenue TaxID=586396 RepID=A0AAV0RW62_9ROSI|nr:unnamed protein product [Linum tenue]
MSPLHLVTIISLYPLLGVSATVARVESHAKIDERGEQIRFRSAKQPPSESQPSKKLDTSAHLKTASETELDSDSDSDADSDPAAPEIVVHALDGVERDLVKKLREMAEGSERAELKKRLNKLDVKYLEFLVG